MALIETIIYFLRNTLGVILGLLLGTLCLSMICHLIIFAVRTILTKCKQLF